jgi:hypothetical protein
MSRRSGEVGGVRCQVGWLTCENSGMWGEERQAVMAKIERTVAAGKVVGDTRLS